MKKGVTGAEAGAKRRGGLDRSARASIFFPRGSHHHRLALGLIASKEGEREALSIGRLIEGQQESTVPPVSVRDVDDERASRPFGCPTRFGLSLRPPSSKGQRRLLGRNGICGRSIN
jgi:hypothetical protein